MHATPHRSRHAGTRRRQGVILLVVLSMLAFLGILVVTYVTFTASSRQSAFGIAAREYRKANPQEAMDDAIATLIRGTSDPMNPFFGEDLLSDLYGIRGSITTSVRKPGGTAEFPMRPMYVGGGFVRIPLAWEQVGGVWPLGADPRSTLVGLDDAYSGRVLTFTGGPLTGKSYRIIRSVGWRPDASPDAMTRMSVYIELNPTDQVTLPNGSMTDLAGLFWDRSGSATTNNRYFNIAALFYTVGVNGVFGNSGQFFDAGTVPDEDGYGLIINGQPLNGHGAGFEGNNLSQDTPVALDDTTMNIPVAYQPGFTNSYMNQSSVDRTVIDGDFDEPYDAADFQNYFLSQTYTDANGQKRVIPSFHRPALINHIVNSYDLSSATQARLISVVEAIRRSTFRPLSFAQGQFIQQTPIVRALPAVNPQFTGGNANEALRTPLFANDPSNIGQMRRLNLFVDALVNGPWDVDNDGDGIPDSVWVDMGLPMITSPEGKLIRPLVAPMIEDLSGRLNVNAHGTHFTTSDLSVNVNEPWGGSTTATAALPVYRGLGFGPAEIVLPEGTSVNPQARVIDSGDLTNLMRLRYAPPGLTSPPIPYAGYSDHDLLDLLVNRQRPTIFSPGAGTGMSVDPFGRGGLGLSRGGELFHSVTGRPVVPTASGNQPVINDNENNPYEIDPSGQLSGDQVFPIDDMGSLLDQSLFSRDGQRSRLDQVLATSRATNPDIARMLTTTSVSLDLPTSINPIGERATGASNPVALMTLLGDLIGSDSRVTNELTLATEQDYLDTILPRELKLGQKLDLNRPFGNGIDDSNLGSRPGVDDDADGVVDEAGEGNGVIDDPIEGLQERIAFPTVPTGSTTNTYLRSLRPNGSNNLDAPALTLGTDDPRTVLARNIYVLLMALTEQGYDLPMDAAMPPTDANRYKALRFAQWAVNLIDYRDPDSIMTRFNYDPSPLDGNWTPSAVVWGVERPDLLFSESLALHDLRVRDTNLDASGRDKTAGMMPDPDTDQVRVPQGSLFLELYHPRQQVIDRSATGDFPHVTNAPLELYRYNGTDYFLELDKTVTTTSGGVTGEVPVWRIAISEPHHPGSANPTASMQQAANDLPNTMTFEPGTGRPLDALGVDTRELALERFVFFTQYANVADLTNVVSLISDINGPERVFFNRSGSSPWLGSEQYLTVAPRERTWLGTQTFVGATIPPGPSNQRFEISTSGTHFGLVHYDLANTLTTPNTTSLTQPGVSMIAGAFAELTNWTGLATRAPTGIGLNVSEPLPSTVDYCTMPRTHYDSGNTDPVTGFPLVDAYVDMATPTDPINRPLDQPLDMQLSGPIQELTLTRNAAAAEPMVGTVEDYRTAFLQRLADPTRGYDPISNPYRTIDHITIDLTVFTGEDSETSMELPFLYRPYAASSRQRDGSTRRGTGTGAVYSYSTTPPPPATAINQATNYFEFTDNAGTPTVNEANIQHTFNFLNQGFGDVRAGTGTIVDTANPSSRGLPIIPFAMHPWLNRDFVSPYELMMVPASSQGRLFEEFTLNQATATVTPYIAEASGGVPTNSRAPFGHLMNFFQTQVAADGAPELMRLFEFVTVPPRFRGEREFVMPSRLPFVPTPGTDPLLNSRKHLSDLFQPPYNTRWDGRRQGRININTVADYPVWMGLMFNHLSPAERSAAAATNPRYQEFLDSRRGYSVGTGLPQGIVDSSNTVQIPPYNFDPASVDPDYPTQFAGVFKTSLDSDLAPPSISVYGAVDQLRHDFPAEGTVLRPGTNDTFDPLWTPDGAGATHLDRSRNAAMEYHSLARTGNLVGINSQTFAVRLTLGYFEVDPVNLWLGQEYNANIGRQKRYKATYVIDRSIPVGFAGPGVSPNAENTVIYSQVQR